MTKKYLSSLLVVLAGIAIFIALVTPNRLSDIYPDSFLRLPLELFLLGLWLVMLMLLVEPKRSFMLLSALS